MLRMKFFDCLAKALWNTYINANKRAKPAITTQASSQKSVAINTTTTLDYFGLLDHRRPKLTDPRAKMAFDTLQVKAVKCDSYVTAYQQQTKSFNVTFVKS